MIKNVKVHITDSGMDGFARKLKSANGATDIGVFGKTDSEMVIIAATHEFGTDRAGRGNKVTIPERAPLRKTLDDQRETIRKAVDEAKVKIVTGRETSNRFLNRLGIWFVGQVRAKIRAGLKPENAPATKIIKRLKGRKNPIPLIDDGHLIQSYTHRVRGVDSE